MKGFEITINGHRVKGAVPKGITGVLISYKDRACRIFFNSLTEAGMFAQTWYSSDLVLGDKIIISYQEIDAPSPAMSIRDYKDEKEMLESYYKMRDELIEEGLITD